MHKALELWLGRKNRSYCKTKTEFYNGKEVIEKQLAEGGNKKLVALKMIDRGIARHGYDVYDGETIVGAVVGVSNNGASDLLSVKTKSKKICLVPFVKAIVLSVDITARRIQINNIEGLLE